MFREALMLAGCSVAIHAWLSVSIPPLLRAMASSALHARDSRTWHALGLALAAALMWTTVALGVGFLAMLLAPQAASALRASGVIEPGAFAGALLWAVQPIATRRIPGFGERVELATAQALSALLADDAGLDVYRAFAISHHPAPPRSIGAYDLAS